MKDENDIKEKQEYLRLNILEKGYNADEFMQYLKMIKGEKGLEIENWSKNDLIKAVIDFKKMNPLNSDDNDDNNYNDNQNNLDDQDSNNIQENNNTQIQGHEYLRCQKSEKNQISEQQNIIINISSPKVTEGSLFTKSYITYLVETKPLGLQVRRRFSDFTWLHDTLKLIYINCIIPPIIKKNYLTGIKDTAINKRMRSVEKFLQEIANHPLLRNSQIFYDFISLRDDKDYNLKKQAYSKLIGPSKIEEIKTLNGEIDISINKDKELLAEKIKNISDNNAEIMKKITKEYKLLNTKIQEVVSKIEDINILWDEIYKKSTSNYDGEIVLGVYDSLAKFMEDWGKMQKEQIDLINIKIREYFRYIKYEYIAIRDFSKTYEDKKNDYKKSYQKLMDTKEKLFSEKNVNNWGMDKEDLDNKVLLFKEKELSMEKMLPDETKRVKDKKKLYGCLLNSFIEQYEIISGLNSKRHKDQISSYIKETSNNIIKFHVSLNELLGYLDTLKEDLFIGENQ
jgi:hypothetical protein